MKEINIQYSIIKRKWRDFTIVYIEYTMMKVNKIL